MADLLSFASDRAPVLGAFAEHAVPEPTTRRPLPRTVRLLGWVSFFADISSEMAYPLLPLFVVGVLGASATSLGTVEGVAQAAVAVLTAWSGWKSDRGRDRRGAARRAVWVRWGYGLPILGKTLLALAVVWPMALLGRAVDRVGKGLRSSPRDAMIADATHHADRGRAFGFHRAMDTAGAFTGVILAAALMLWLGGFNDAPADASPTADLEGPIRLILIIAAIMSLASFVLTLRVRDRPPLEAPAPASVSAPSSAASSIPLPRAYWLTVLPMFIFALGNSSDTFILLRASDLGLSPFSVILAYALFNLSFSLASYPAGVISDRLGRWRTITAGWIIYAGAYVGFAMLPAAGIWLLMPLYGVFAALFDGVGKALITDVAPSARRGAALGIFYMGTGFAMLSGSIIAGVLWDHVGHAAPFWAGAALAIVAVAIVPIIARMIRTPRGQGSTTC